MQPSLLAAAHAALYLLERIIEGREWGAIEEITDDLREAIVAEHTKEAI
jgi:hypothetical protein